MRSLYTTPGLFPAATIIEPEKPREKTSEAIRSKVFNHSFTLGTENLIKRFNTKRMRSLIDNLPVEGRYMIDPNWDEFHKPLSILNF